MAISTLCCPWVAGDSWDGAGAGFDLCMALQPASPCSHPSSSKDTSGSGQVPAVLCGNAEIKALCHFTGLCQGSQAAALKGKCLKCLLCCLCLYLKGSDPLSVCPLNAPSLPGDYSSLGVQIPFFLVLFRLRPLDIEFMKRLSKVVNIVPVIAKADTLTLEERDYFKQRVRKGLLPLPRLPPVVPCCFYLLFARVRIK